MVQLNVDPAVIQDFITRAGSIIAILSPPATSAGQTSGSGGRNPSSRGTSPAPPQTPTATSSQQAGSASAEAKMESKKRPRQLAPVPEVCVSVSV